MEWRLVQLGDVCKIDKQKFRDGELPYVGMEDIESHTGKFLGTTNSRVVVSSTFEFSNQHVLYGRLRPYLNKVLVPDFDGHCSSEIFPLKPSDKLDRRFLFYWLSSEKVVSDIDKTCTGARMPRANVKEVLTFGLPLPPIPEQKRIVAILDQAFAEIEQARAKTEQNLKNARELFESYLQQVFSQRGEGWVEGTMEELCKLITCGVASTPKYVDESIGVAFLSAQNVKDGKVRLHKFRHISKDFHSELTKKNKPQLGDILYSRVGAGFGDAAVVEHSFEFSVYVSLTLIKPDPEKLNNYFLKYYLNSPPIKTLAKESITSSGVPNLNVKSVRGFKLAFPSLKKQEELVRGIESIEKETTELCINYKSKLAELDELKKSILQKAFNGELEIKSCA